MSNRENKYSFMEANIFKEFMRGIIDYAGMYPPAVLGLKPAFANYIQYLESEDEWIISKFVCSVKSFSDIFAKKDVKKILDGYKGGRWIDFSILITGGQDQKEFKSMLEKECGIIRDILAANTGKISVSSLEAKISSGMINTFANYSLKKLLNKSSEIIINYDLTGARLYVEPEINAKYETIFSKTAEAAAECDHKGGRAGFKLRTGGVTPDAFPTIEQVAAALDACKENQAHFKATAGLHHPVRHFNRTVGTKMHGFLNIFGAGILHFANTLSMKELKEILSDESSTGFVFSEDEFYWNDIAADAEKTMKARSGFVTSFGSCSFDEPREDLKNIGLWFNT
mgnify:FL=1